MLCRGIYMTAGKLEKEGIQAGSERAGSGMPGRPYGRIFPEFIAKEGKFVNIQIFGTKKCFDTKKAQRYFKERGIKYQFTDLTEKCLSKGGLRSVIQAAGGLDALPGDNCRDQDAAALARYTAQDEKEEKLLADQQILKTLVVRNGKLATAGCQPDVWKNWK